MTVDLDNEHAFILSELQRLAGFSDPQHAVKGALYHYYRSVVCREIAPFVDDESPECQTPVKLPFREHGEPSTLSASDIAALSRTSLEAFKP